MRHVIVGGSAAGTVAAETLRRHRLHDDIVVVDCDPALSYARCLLPQYVGGGVPRRRLSWRSPSWFKARRIDLVRESATRVDTDERCVWLADGRSLAYDTLLVSTGSLASLPPSLGEGDTGIVGLRTLRDAERLRRGLRPGSTVLVVGGGFVGLKLSAALTRAGAQVLVVEADVKVLGRMADAEAGGRLVRLLEKNGVGVKLATTVEGVEPNLVWAQRSGRGVRKPVGYRVFLSDRSSLVVDKVVVAAGVEANSACLAESGAELLGGCVVVDACQATGVPDVYAAGDVCSVRHSEATEAESYGIWPVACEQGRVAGMNMAGLVTRAERFVPMNTLEFFDRCFTSIGRPHDRCGEVSHRVYRSGETYQKLTLVGDVPVRFLAVGGVWRAGIVATAIRYGVPLAKLLAEPGAHVIPVLSHGAPADD